MNNMLAQLKTFAKSYMLFKNKKLIAASLFFTLVFVLNRLPFFSYINLVRIVPDSGSYLEVFQLFITGKTPMFMFRTPGYPLFLLFSYLISNKLITVVYLQTAISLFTSLFFIRAINKTYPKYTFPVCFGMIISMNSVIYLDHETAIQPEHLYINLLIITLGLLILALKGSQKRYWLLSSVFMMIAIYVRPSGLFMIPVFGLVLLFLFINKYSMRIKLYFALPVLALFILLSTYNLITLKRFTFSPFGAFGRIGTVITYMEPDAEFPGYVNESIKAIQLEIPANLRQDVKNQTDYKTLQAIFISYFDHLTHLYREMNIRDKEKPKDYIEAFNKQIDDAKLITSKTIEKNPELYKKFVKTMLYQYFVCIDGEQSITYNYLTTHDQSQEDRVAGSFNSKPYKQGQYYSFELQKMAPSVANQKLTYLLDGKTFKFPRIYSIISSRIFQHLFWVFLSFGIFIFSGIRLIISKFKNIDSLIIFVIVSMNLSAALLTCLVQMGMIRYASTLHFTYYLAPALLPILFSKFWVSAPPIKNNTKRK